MSENTLKYNNNFTKPISNSSSNINPYGNHGLQQNESTPYSNNYLKDKPYIQSFAESTKKILWQCNSDGAVKITNSDQNNLSISDLSANKYSQNFKPSLFSPDITTDDFIDGKRTGNFTTADHTPRNTFILEQKDDIDGYSTNPREYQKLSENIKLVLSEKLMEYPQKKRGLLEQQRVLLQKEREILEKEQ